METVVDEINRAIRKLGFSPEEFHVLPDEEVERVYCAALDRFVSSGDRQWWWEDFRTPGKSVSFAAGDGWRHLVHVVPDPDAKIWFMVEETSLPYYPIYETTTKHAMQVVGECYGFEFYIVASDFGWLVCETHHDNVCAVGEAVEQRLLEYVSGSEK